MMVSYLGSGVAICNKCQYPLNDCHCFKKHELDDLKKRVNDLEEINKTKYVTIGGGVGDDRISLPNDRRKELEKDLHEFVWSDTKTKFDNYQEKKESFIEKWGKSWN